ncbi:MAG: deoxyribodipyrimidine photolyase [Rickettsiales bacterium]|nr:deoxyribodipyrimidine photolyase [Rickettsiales bacterium]|tara:strand:+ start:1244 stop:2674 length:1431 start_codon:yes stop_codon:yes gene_type:complete
MSDTLQLVWLRRDLRLYDHAALHAALQGEGNIQPVFVFDTEVLTRFSNKDDRRLTFLATTLEGMHRSLKRYRSGIIVMHGKASELIPQAADALGAARVMCEEDYEPGPRKRDEAVAKALEGQCEFKRVIDHVIFPPEKILKDDGGPYKVFTPYSKKWRQHIVKDTFAEKPVALNGRTASFDDCVNQLRGNGISVIDLDQGTDAALEKIGYKKADLGQWKTDQGRKRLSHFVEKYAQDYYKSRDYLADEEGTSRLSPYLRHGLVSIREAARLVQERSGKGYDTWLNELIWREFYQQIYYHFPEAETQEFNEKYRSLNWSQSEASITAFKEGKTGYPIVDAAMRQLLQEGWMHNRARMIVASFATKDLHIDWRVGEEHFAQHLMDYEMASNNGGWQWAASTGTDAQPYFRIFNPTLQSEKYDKEGIYIKRFIPELKNVDQKYIHQPHASDKNVSLDYPKTIVDHKQEKEKAIAKFKAA